MTLDGATIARLRAHGSSALVSDCLDRIGQRDRTLAPGVVPLAGSGVLVGRARTARSVPVTTLPERPYTEEIALVDSLVADDVVIGTVGAPVAFWGELFSTAARARGAAGLVLDGVVRDRSRIVEMGWPVFARGTHPTDCNGRISVVERDAPITILGVRVAPGDLVVADMDGVVVAPAAVAAEVAAAALAKAETEDGARAYLETGALLREAWDRFRVL
ncbi:MAG: RraA family protein [Chloroflexota bacterium]